MGTWSVSYVTPSFWSFAAMSVTNSGTGSKAKIVALSSQAPSVSMPLFSCKRSSADRTRACAGQPPRIMSAAAR